MMGDAVNGCAFGAHLRPSGAAVLANTTTEVVVYHNAGVLLREARIDSSSELGDHATRFVARNRRP